MWEMRRDFAGLGKERLAVMPADEDMPYWNGANPLPAIDAGDAVEVRADELPFQGRPDVEWVRLEADDRVTPLYPVLAYLAMNGTRSAYPSVLAHVEDGPEALEDAEARARFPEAVGRYETGFHARQEARARGD
jgi:hypothetical protein